MCRLDSPSDWTDYTYDSELGIAEGVPLAFPTQLEFLMGNEARASLLGRLHS